MKKFLGLFIAVLALNLTGCGAEKASVNIFYTTDMHGHFTKSLEGFLKENRKDNDILVDSGDIEDIQTDDDNEWSNGYKSLGAIRDFNCMVSKRLAEPEEGLGPTLKKMAEYKYDFATIGNHEFYRTYDQFNNLLKNSKDANLPLMSANVFYVDGDKRVSDPYYIKNIKTEDGDIKLAFIPITTNTIGTEPASKDGKLVKDKKYWLQNEEQYKGKMYMTDAVEECKKISEELQKKEKPDVVVIVAHSGVQPKKPRHTGNRIQELAKEVPNVDLIIGGHTHKFVDEKLYNGVVYTEAGCHSKAIGEATINLEKKGDKWKVEKVEAKLTKFKPDKNDPEDDASEEDFHYKLFTKDEVKKELAEDPSVFLMYTIFDKNPTIENKEDPTFKLTHTYKDEKDGTYIHYIEGRNVDMAEKFYKENDILHKQYDKK